MVINVAHTNLLIREIHTTQEKGKRMTGNREYKTSKK